MGKRSHVYCAKEGWSQALPPFGRVFKKYKKPGYRTDIVEVLEGDIVRLVPLEDVRDAIVAWARSPDLPGAKVQAMRVLFAPLVDAKDAMYQAETWVATFVDEALTELPPAVRFKSDKGLCFSRLPFDLIPNATLDACPTWRKVLDRIVTNRDAFIMRIAAMFDPNANRKQAIWLWGAGDTGKSFIFDTIGSLFGNAYVSSSTRTAMGEFWLATLVGKRFVHIYECSPRFVTGDESVFKGLTGDSNHLVNRKGRDHVPARLDCLLVMSANPKLELPADDALYNRIIDCRILALDKGDAHADEATVRPKLLAELPAFLSFGWAMYQARKFPNGRIPTDRDALQEGTAEFYEEELRLFDSYFEASPGAELEANQVFHVLRSQGHHLNGPAMKRVKEAWGALRGVEAYHHPKTRRAILRNLKAKDFRDWPRM